MSAKNLKQLSAEATRDYIQPGQIIGVGTGSTVDLFIPVLAEFRTKIRAAIASSKQSRDLLLKYQVPMMELRETDCIDIYIDGADEINSNLQMIKGGGGALTQEKIIAHMSDKFICIADESKLVKKLGSFPLPLEVIEMASNSVSRELILLGGKPVLREGFITDNGHKIIDVSGLDMDEPLYLEDRINQIPGVISVGLFVRDSADILLLGKAGGVDTFTKK